MLKLMILSSVPFRFNMNYFINISFLFLAFYSVQVGGFAQSIDSIEKAILSSNDAEKISQLSIDLGIAYEQKEQFTEAEKAFLNAIEQASDKALAYRTIGDYYIQNVNYSKALKYRKKELEIRLRSNNIRELAGCYNNVAIVYNRLYRHNEALDAHLKALQLRQKLGEKTEISNSYMNIAYLHQNREDYKEASKNYKKALDIKTTLQNDSLGLATTYLNFGGLKILMQEYVQAKNYLKKAVELYKALNNQTLLAYALINLSEAYREEGQQEQAYNYLNQAKALKSINNYAWAGIYEGFAQLKLLDKLPKQAIALFDTAKSFHSKTGSENAIIEVDKHLSECYAELGNFQQAYTDFKSYRLNKEKLEKENSIRIISDLKEKYASEQKIKEILSKERELEHQKQTNKIYILLGLIMLLALAYLSYLIKKRIKQNQIIETQTRDLEKEQKNTQESIEYAQKIQESFLTKPERLKKIIGSHLLFYRPKNIISGDFYWTHQTTDYLFLATVDCTGHGVPGALMSMLGNRLLNEIIIQKSIYEPAKILEALHQGVVSDLKQEAKGKSQDGMDLFLVRIDQKNKTMHYAGAKNRAYIIENDKLSVLQTSLRSIGGRRLFKRALPSFKTFEQAIKKDMKLYMFTDGYADQFGGHPRKKMGSKAFKNLLLNIHHHAFDTQNNLIEQHFENFKDSQEQIDDVLIFGLSFETF